jgi:menaquinone-dependent protoporphyrinogen IX oxidase
MSNMFDAVWSEILSRQPARIKTAFAALSPDDQAQVNAHLRKMVNEEGWHPEQVASAQAALEAIGDEQR